MTHEEFLDLKPSAFLRLALDDVEECHKDKDYEVDMGYWHRRPREEGDPCYVCAAGAVLSKTLNLPLDAKDMDLTGYVEGLGFTGDDARKAHDRLCALDHIRLNDHRNALNLLRIKDHHKWSWDPADIHVERWENDRKAFHEGVSELADRLEQEGH